MYSWAKDEELSIAIESGKWTEKALQKLNDRLSDIANNKFKLDRYNEQETAALLRGEQITVKGLLFSKQDYGKGI